ncbi:MAG: fumarylacetoacetate hydrolase family protein [Acidimicrobiia bacterium]|nr:fumarylacetoacetate hydrolase family protein [Acidimicrobiia bacterium]
MKIVRFKAGDDIAYGLAEAEGVTVYQGSPLFAWEATETVVPWEDVQLLAPVLPSKVIAVDANFLETEDDGAAQLSSDPLITLKPATAVTGPNAPIVHPPATSELVHQASLAVIVGRLARAIRAEDASQYIFGYTAASDMVAADIERSEARSSRARSYDTFCPLGPAVETELDPLERLAIISRVDGDVRQAGFTSDMIFGVAEILAFVSTVMTLLPGDVVLMGTPPGAAPVAPGDVVETEVDGIGSLFNRIVRA